MPVFELQADGKTFEVEAPDMETASASLHAHTGQAPGMAEGIGRAAARGVPIFGGALNKLDAATNAALSPVVDPLLPDSFVKLKGKNFSERYAHALELQEGKDKSFAEHPIADAVAEIGGGIAATGAAAATTQARRAGAGPHRQDAAADDGARRGLWRGDRLGDAGRARGKSPDGGRRRARLSARSRRRSGGSSTPKWCSRSPTRCAASAIPAGEAERRVASAINRDIQNNDRGMTLQEMTDARAAGPAGDADGRRRRDHAGAGAQLRQHLAGRPLDAQPRDRRAL
jgi:hypothetical protein